MRTITIWMAALGLFLSGSFFAPTKAIAAESRVASDVDLAKYLGSWYEIAAIPQIFEKQCDRDTMANYSFSNEKDNLVKVLNSCKKANGETISAEGRGRLADKADSAKFKVTFLKVAGYWVFVGAADYWILDIASDYSYALVGDPKQTYAWILSRQPSLDLQTLIKIDQKLKMEGYDTCKLIITRQTGGLQDRQSLCKVAAPAPDVFQLLADDGRFNVFVAALKTAGLQSQLQGPGPYTLFAPTDEAFQKIPQDVLRHLLADPAVLKRVLLNHVVLGSRQAAQIEKETQLTTLSGDRLVVHNQNGELLVNQSKVVIKNMPARNGVIQAIDNVLIP